MVHPKKFRNKKTGEIVTQFRLLDIANYEPVEEKRTRKKLKRVV
jgi:hypothetical protein